MNLAIAAAAELRHFPSLRHNLDDVLPKDRSTINMNTKTQLPGLNHPDACLSNRLVTGQ